MTRITAHRPWRMEGTVLTPAAPTLQDGACQQEGAPNREDWFQGEGESTAEWKLRQKQLVRWHCASCPVMWLCRGGAVERGEKHGVWGGLTEAELRRVQLSVKKRQAAEASEVAA